MNGVGEDAWAAAARVRGGCGPCAAPASIRAVASCVLLAAGPCAPPSLTKPRHQPTGQDHGM